MSGSMANRIDLHGRKAVVTGAARGIGLAIAERLLDSGAAVSLWDVDGPRLAESARALSGRGEMDARIVDVTKSDSVDRAAAELDRRWNGIDVLVNNAGILGPIKDSWTHTNEDWRGVIEVVLTGTFLCTRAMIVGMVARSYGRIVNIASVSGKEGSPGLPAYSAAKAGVIGLTKSMAREVAHTGVHINCITPATIDTEMVREQSTPDMIAYGLARIPMARLGRSEEIAALAAWLASEECSFTTGGVFDASGGRSSY